MKHIKLFEAFEDKSILDSDFIVDTLNDIKKEAFVGKAKHEQIEFEWNPKNLQLTITVKPEEVYSRFGLSKEKSEEDLENDMPLFSERISWMLSEATKRIQEEGISLESGDDTSFGRTGFHYIRRINFRDEKVFLYQLLVKHLQKFEAFLIPKPVRKFNPFWKDEDIALEILKELKSLKGNSEGIAKLLISEDRGYSFTIDGFKFHVKYGFRFSPGGGSYNGDMKMNDKYMKVSTEVCKQIYNLVEKLKNTEHIEMEEDDKKDFRISRGLI